MAAGSILLPGCSTVTPRPSANNRLNIICVGGGGKGGSDIANCATENILAICDVDERMAAPSLAKFPMAKYYKDWRIMLERETEADAVIVSTPDHTHAAIAAAAMRMKKAVYCQKPLTRTVHESRTLAELARTQGVVTQMGNQGSAEDGLRRAIEVVQSGLLGQVRNVHVWSNRPIWPQGIDRPDGADPIPPGLDWDLWLGPAPARNYKESVYHRFNWRGWQDFGTGALGDMGCHTLNMAFRALRLDAPRTVEADSSGMNTETYPKDSMIRFTFGRRQNMDAVDVWWYDGGRKPDSYLLAHVENLLDEVPESGCLLVGSKGLLFSPDDYGARFFIKLRDEDDLSPGLQHEQVVTIPETIQRNGFKGDAGVRHAQEWIAACKGEGSCYSDFPTMAPLNEMLLLGCAALHSERRLRRLRWEPEKMRFDDAPEFQSILQPAYREGWQL